MCVILLTPKRQTSLTVMNSSISVAWQAKHIRTASPGFIVRTGSVELSNKLRVVLAFTRDFPCLFLFVE